MCNHFGRQSEQARAAFTTFSQLNYEYRSYVRQNQEFYEEGLATATAPKLFHSYIRRRRECPSVSPLRLLDGEVVSEAAGMSKLLGESFASVFVNDYNYGEVGHQLCDGNMRDIVFNQLDVEDA